MTFEQAVERISKKFLKRAGKTGDFNAEVLLTDADCGGIFSIRVTNGKVAVEPYEYHDCDVRINCTYDNFIKFISDEESTYDMHCNSTRFADILAVVRKGVKSAAKKTAEPKDSKPEVDEKPAEAEVKQESETAETKKEPAKKETPKKGTAKKETAKKETAKKEPAKKRGAASKTGKAATTKKTTRSAKSKSKVAANDTSGNAASAVTEDTK